MILDNLSKSDLQHAIGSVLLERLETLAPVLFPELADPTLIYKRKNLIKILLSFKGGHMMKDQEFLRILLNSLPPKTLDSISKATGVGITVSSFEEKLEKILAQGWRHLDYCENFLAVTGLPNSFLPSSVAYNLPQEDIASIHKPFKRLKSYQYGVYKMAMEMLCIPHARFIMHMPTGSGKTRTAMEFIVDSLNEAPEHGIIVWLAHSEELCEQSIQCFKEVWTHIGSGKASICRAFGVNWSLPSDSADKCFLVGGFQKLYGLLKKNNQIFAKYRSRIKLLVVDEAHKATAPTYKHVIKELVGDKTCLVGLTATPGRSIDDVRENKELAKLFFGKVISIETPNNESIFSYLRREKILARTILEPLITSRAYQLTESHKRRLTKEFDFPNDFLETLGDDDIRNIEIFKRIKCECKASKKIIFFACSIKHSQFISALLSFYGIQVAHIDGSTERNERANKINAFKNGDVQVLCNYGVLSTGFDAPNTDVVFISRPTRSIVLYSQMIGRGLRGPAIGGTSECKVINVIDNIIGLPREGVIYDYFEEYWMND